MSIVELFVLVLSISFDEHFGQDVSLHFLFLLNFSATSALGWFAFVLKEKLLGILETFILKENF